MARSRFPDVESDRHPGVGLAISKKPALPSQPLSSIISKHRCPSFLHHLRAYLNRLLPRREAIPCIQLPHAHLPFDHLDVWHTFKFSLDTLGNDVDGQEKIDSSGLSQGKVEGRWEI